MGFVAPVRGWIGVTRPSATGPRDEAAAPPTRALCVPWLDLALGCGRERAAAVPCTSVWTIDAVLATDEGGLRTGRVISAVATDKITLLDGAG